MNLICEAAVSEHALLCARAFVDSPLGERYEADERLMTRLFLRGIRENRVFVALEDRAFRGAFWFSEAGGFDDFPYLRVLAVASDARGSGVGSFLMDQFEEKSAALAKKAFLLVSDFNEGAQRFYERRGWVKCGALEDVYREGITEVLMMRKFNTIAHSS